MKKLYFLLAGIFFFGNVNAQVINFPDPAFKAKLLSASYSQRVATGSNNEYRQIDINNNGEIEISEAQSITLMKIDRSNITSLEGIEYFTSLKHLDCAVNSLELLNVESLKSLGYLDCAYNKLNSLKVNDLSKIYELYCQFNQLVNLDLRSLTSLSTLRCDSNKITSLNISGLTNLITLDCQSNSLTTLELKGLINLYRLVCANNIISTLNVEDLANLDSLWCSNNQLSELNLRNLINLGELGCYGNQLTILDLGGLLKMGHLICSNNKITSLNLSGLTKLRDINCSGNKLSVLDVSELIWLDFLGCSNNKLTSLFIKNGRNEYVVDFSNNPNLNYICADESELSQVEKWISTYGFTNCFVNSYCSFAPGGTYYTVQGNSKIDANNNGCDSNDEACSNLNFSITDGIKKGNFFSDISGNINIRVQEQIQTITPILENPNYFAVSPPSISVNFPAQTSPFIQNFCITPNGVRKDLEVTILPTIPARPGFDATYKIIYKNKGNQTQSGSVVLSFNDAVLDLVSAVLTVNNQVTDKLTWDYTNLKPLESREIIVTFNVNSPMETPAVNIDDRLSFNALITPIAGDEKPVDNSFALRQTVVGSYDPNDKTCLEGDIITPDLIGEYVHYLIRFENTGTYPAENVVIKDLIDLTKFDISTLIPTKASHDFVTKISDGNKVEFIFEKINLPFDDANNDGYIAFKIKTLPTLKVGDSFQNEANIYFDYNFPILTNTAKSTFQTLGTQDFEFSDYFSLYPNPANDIVNIAAKNSIEVKSMSVYDVLGQIVIAVLDAKTISNIDVSKLSSGNYFLKMNTNKGTSNVKFIKK
jgi:Leucine-rich repeat (LRR) protein